MPSCVVRWCKNSSIVQNKAVGITFHKFPRDFVWKRKWMDVIRVCRSDETWIPSKFSVVCSTHFADEDLYQTKFGLRRVKKNAIPKRYLTKPTIDNDVPVHEFVSCIPNIESQNQIVEIIQEPCNLESYYSDKQSNESNVEPPPLSQPISEIKFESLEIVTVKVEPTSPDTHNSDKSSNEVQFEPNSTSPEIFKVKIEPGSLATSDKNTNIQALDITMPEENHSCATPSVHDSDIDSVYDSPLECKLKRQLRKQMKLGEIRRKKIKTLNQKIRRMKKTNNRLHDTIKKLREKNQVLTCSEDPTHFGPLRPNDSIN